MPTTWRVPQTRDVFPQRNAFAFFCLSGKRLPAVGAEAMFRLPRLAASGADGEGAPAEALARRLAVFLENPPAAVAFQKRLSPFDRNEGNEEKAQIMIQALQPG
jgi:hypothetical protein